jgi:hypothetical protein
MAAHKEANSPRLISETSPVASQDISPFELYFRSQGKSPSRGHLILLDGEPLFWVTAAERPFVVLCGTGLH